MINMLRLPASILAVAILSSLAFAHMSAASEAANATVADSITFEKLRLSDQFYGEGATFADMNHDGNQDVVSGPYWYAGPEFTERHEYYPAKQFDIEGYSDNFLAFTRDFNNDGWDDILIVGFPGAETRWYENPQGKADHWKRHLAFAVTDNESPTFANVVGDKTPELVCMTGGRAGYAVIPKDPAQPWKFHAVSKNRGFQRFTHGLGIGDVNGDGLMDMLAKDGWWEQPAADASESSPAGGDAQPTDQAWAFHEVQFSGPGGAQMFAYDFDGDGDNDVITSKAAHSYGLSWFENLAETGKIDFREHVIMSEQPGDSRPSESGGNLSFSQLHAAALVDIDGDGVKDFVTGKRWWAHSTHDPGSLEPAVLYWFQTVRDGQQTHFKPHLIDDNSGVGTQVVARDYNGDRRPDILVGSKKGTFLFTQSQEGGESEPEKATNKPGGAGDAKNAADATDKGDADDAFLATDDGGRALNLDFETGDLTDWTAAGNAFQGQPVKGDKVHARRDDSTSEHRGDYWIGTYEVGGDGVEGTLTSAPFKVTHPYASFLIGGGGGKALGVQIVRAKDDEVIAHVSGRNREELQPVIVDLSDELGKKIFLRVIDRGRVGWGHVNFDHFRFHDQKPAFPEPAGKLTPDIYPYAGLPGEKAVSVMKLPEGFQAKLFAAEPDVKQPIAMTLDHQGRVWIAEAYEYPVRAPEGQGRDRILIFEDVDGDGKFDKRTIFAEGLNLVSGMEVGFGGVWVGASPYLMFIPDRNGDDVSDGEPEILLDGWAREDTHETLNTFTWGPDGWLYGCHGVFTHSKVGKPGAAAKDRVPLDAAIWRYHPTRHEFEVFAEGTSNPWGIDFDAHGQAFATACVIPHLYHMIQGGRYQRQAGPHANPYTYDDIKTIADHRHYVGDNPHAGNGNSDDAGGGHAHAGAMIYQGGAWPEKYRGRIFMNNIHGQRINTDILKRQGSGFVGSHGPDFLLSGDIASQILNLRYGPDGQALVIDWYDTNACHHKDVAGHDRSNGRIYKIVYGESKPVQVDLAKLSDLELAELVLNENDWYVRHARRALQERQATGEVDRAARDRLVEIASSNQDSTRQLRAMWALHVTGGLPGELAATLIKHANPYVRSWTIQLAMESQETIITELAAELERMAKQDPSPVVRLYIASALQNMPLPQRWPIVRALLTHAEDVNDHNLPLMYWYAAEPLAAQDPQRAIELGMNAGDAIPLVREFMIRRIAEIDSPQALAALVERIAKSDRSEEQLTLLHGLRAGLKGRRQAAPPAAWPAAFAKALKSDDSEVRMQAAALGVTFGDQSAKQTLRETVVSHDAPPAARREALDALLRVKDAELPSVLLKLLDEPPMRLAALTGMALYDNEAIPRKILETYGSLSQPEQRAALATLSSRPSYALELLRAVKAGKVPAVDIPANLIRQIQNLKNPELDQLLVETWGQVRSTPADKAKMIAELHELLDNPPSQPSVALGRAVFAKTCQQCHTLYGVGAKIGPDITGANRSDLKYLLTNVVDPSAVIPKDYQQTIVLTIDGLVVSGIVKSEDAKSLTIQTPTDVVVIPKDEIEDRQLSELSMMPSDQLKQFKPEEIASLFAYLSSKRQTPLLATKDNQELFFNGKDLANWSGDPELWSVEKDQLVGRSSGLDHNEFLFSDFLASDFRLTLEVKLVDDQGNSGVQFRSERLENGEAKGYQADIGPGWWGKLYEEQGRGLLSEKSGGSFVKRGEWNQYKIVAKGDSIKTWINGKPCVDLHDSKGKRSGLFAFQLHAGGPMEVRFRNLKLEVLPSSAE